MHYDFPFSIYLDTNCLNEKGDNPAITKLEELVAQYGSILEKTDVMDTEMLDGNYHAGIRKSMALIETLGPAVWDHSRWGHSVFGIPNDEHKVQELLSCLFGSRSRDQYRKQQIRDAMHLWAAGRASGNYFVTYDKAILKKAAEVRSITGGLLPCTPEDCLDAIEKWMAKLNDLSKGQEDPTTWVGRFS